MIDTSSRSRTRGSISQPLFSFVFAIFSSGNDCPVKIWHMGSFGPLKILNWYNQAINVIGTTHCLIRNSPLILMIVSNVSFSSSQFQNIFFSVFPPPVYLYCFRLLINLRKLICADLSLLSHPFFSASWLIMASGLVWPLRERTTQSC